MAAISVRIPDALNNALQEVVNQEGKSKSFLIKKAIQSYLEDLQGYNLAEKGYKGYLDDQKQGINRGKVYK